MDSWRCAQRIKTEAKEIKVIIMKIKLSVPRFQQENDRFCGPAALQSVLAYYGKNVSQLDIRKATKATKKGKGVWLPYLGAYAKRLGFDVELIMFDTNFIDPTWKNLNKKELIKKLTKRMKIKKELKGGYKSLIYFLKCGGKLSLKIPNEKIILESLKNKIPPIISVCNTIFYKSIRFYKDKGNDIRGVHGGHIIAINGYDGTNFLVADPAVDEKKYKIFHKTKISRDHLLFSWFMGFGWILIIKK